MAALTDRSTPAMAIGYLTGEFPRATDTWIQREVAGLRAIGFDVTTFSVRRPGAEHLVGPEQEESQRSSVYLLELARSSALLTAHLGSLVRSPRRYWRGLRRAWSSRRPGVRGSVYQLIYFAEGVLLGDQMRRRGITHLHNHFGDSSCSVAMLASEVSGIPYSFTLHGAAIFFEPYTWRLDHKIGTAAFVNTISNFARSQAAVFARPEDLGKLHIVHCGIEPDRHRPVVHEGRATTMLFVGRVVEAKGLGVVFEAMKALEETHPQLRLTVVGDGPDRASLAQRAARMGLADRVDFVGARSQDEVANHLAETDIFVLASFAEGLPVVLMEALASSVAAVTTQIAGVPELIRDDETGLLVAPGDVDGLAQALSRLADDPALRQRLGDAGRQAVLDGFDSSVEAARLGRLFLDSESGLASATRPEPMTITAAPAD